MEWYSSNKGTLAVFRTRGDEVRGPKVRSRLWPSPVFVLDKVVRDLAAVTG